MAVGGNATLRPLYSWNNPVPFVYEAGWAQGRTVGDSILGQSSPSRCTNCVNPNRYWSNGN